MFWSNNLFGLASSLGPALLPDSRSSRSSLTTQLLPLAIQLTLFPIPFKRLCVLAAFSQRKLHRPSPEAPWEPIDLWFRAEESLVICPRLLTLAVGSPVLCLFMQALLNSQLEELDLNSVEMTLGMIWNISRSDRVSSHGIIKISMKSFQMHRCMLSNSKRIESYIWMYAFLEFYMCSYTHIEYFVNYLNEKNLKMWENLIKCSTIWHKYEIKIEMLLSAMYNNHTLSGKQ